MTEFADALPEHNKASGGNAPEDIARWINTLSAGFGLPEPELGAVESDKTSSFGTFWADTHQQLQNDYRDEAGQGGESCKDVAIEVARRLKAQGKKPSILALRGTKIDTINTRDLVPLAYEGRIRWGGHMVCVADGLVYDPMLKVPEPWEGYGLKAFGDEVTAQDVSWLLEG